MAGDGAGVSSGVGGGAAAVAASVSSTGSYRMSRYAASASASASTSAASSFSNNPNNNTQVDRRPLIIEFGSTIIRAGHADQFQPQHLIPLSKPLFGNVSNKNNNNDDDDDSSNHNMTESEWYIKLSPIIHEVFERLMVKPSSRYVMCVTQSFVVSTNFTRALKQHFWNLNVPAIVILNSLEVGPSTRAVFGLSRSLMVQIHRHETVCGCYADGYVLPFTYQSIPIGYHDMLAVMDEKNGDGDGDEDSDDSKLLLLDRLLTGITNPNSILTAMLLCLQECPLDVRSYAVSNIMFSGEGVTLLPDVPRRVTKHLQQLLLQQGSGTVTATATSEAETTSSTSLSSEDPQRQRQEQQLQLSMVPIDYKSLQPLGERVGLVSCAPYRPDVVCWVGASLYATTWMKYNDRDESPIPWIYHP